MSESKIEKHPYNQSRDCGDVAGGDGRPVQLGSTDVGRLVEAGAITVNEVRQWHRLPPVPWGGCVAGPGQPDGYGDEDEGDDEEGEEDGSTEASVTVTFGPGIVAMAWLLLLCVSACLLAGAWRLVAG